MERGVDCLICGLNPITRADFDGLCLSCRAAVATNLYRIEWAYPDPRPSERDRKRRRECGIPGKPYRVVVFATAAEHPLGCEWPRWLDPILYQPELLGARWRAIDRARDELNRAETVLLGITQWG